VGDVAALVYEVRRSDSNQLLCVPLPSGKHRRRCDRPTMLGIDDMLGIDCKCNLKASPGLNVRQMLPMRGSQATQVRGSLDKSKGLLGGGKSFGSKML
jgi:hypothetical protein